MSLFCMPSLGSDMERATLIEWLVEPGATLRRGDLIAVVETDKGAIEIEVFEDGRLGTLLVELGDEVLVGAPLAEIIGDTPAADTTAAVPGPKPVSEPSAAAPQPSPMAAMTMPQPVPPSGHRASPAARALAGTHNIDLAAVQGSGPDGVIVYVDVQQAVETQSARAGAPAAGDSGPSQMRRAIAAAMARSKREIPHYYLGHTVDFECSSDWLAQTNVDRAPRERLLAIALLAKAAALALREHGDFNGLFEDGEYRPSTRVHLGMAIAIRGGGLVAPAVHDTDKLSLDELMQRLKDLTRRVRAGRFRAAELRDPTATVTSLGERGVESVYSVIYPPQVASIGFGRIVDRPWSMADRSVVSRQSLTVTLAADHRVSDGRAGAKLLMTIDALLQRPDEL